MSHMDESERIEQIYFGCTPRIEILSLLRQPTNQIVSNCVLGARGWSVSCRETSIQFQSTSVIDGFLFEAL